MVRSEALIRAQKKYYEKNKEKIEETKRKWTKNNREYYRQRSKEYYQKNKLQILKNYRNKKYNNITKSNGDQSHRIMTKKHFERPINVFAD
tara:strand:- start:5205 stop:5477 length:273 start_codon:yes stop_codon:yes gene_type:complete